MIEKLMQRFKPSKYKNWYFNIIINAINSNRRKRKPSHPEYVYYELHHIIPKFMDSQLQNLYHNKFNGVLLTAKEHILVHWLLCKMFDKNTKEYSGAVRAFFCMAIKNNGNRNKRNFNIGVVAAARALSSELKCKKRGIKGVPRWYDQGKTIEDLKNELQHYVDQGISDPQISKIVNTSTTMVYEWRKKLGVDNRRSMIRDEKWLRDKYEKDLLSTGDIAKIAGCTQTAIQQKFKQFGIEVRSATDRQKLANKKRLK